MLTYIVFYTLICIFSNIYSKKVVLKTINGDKHFDFMFASFLIMATFLGLRNGIGLDDEMYSRTFQEIYSNGSPWRDIEVSYTWISKIVQLLGGTVQLVFLIYAIITCFFLYLSIKKLVKNENRWIFWGIFLSLMFLTSITLMRQFAAGSLLLYGYCCWRENKRKITIVLLILAGIFHTSAFLAIPYYFLSKYTNKINKNIKIIVLVLCYIMQYIPVTDVLVNIVGTIPGLSNFYYMKYYLLTPSRFFFDSLGVIETCYLLLFIYMMYISNKKNSSLKIEKSIINETEMESFSFLYFVIRMLFAQFGYLHRISYYLEFFMIIYLSNCNKVFNKSSQRAFKIIGIVILFFLFIYAVYSYRMQGSQYNPLIPYNMNVKLFE